MAGHCTMYQGTAYLSSSAKGASNMAEPTKASPICQLRLKGTSNIPEPEYLGAPAVKPTEKSQKNQSKALEKFNDG